MIGAYSRRSFSPQGYWLLSKRGRAHEIFLIVEAGEPSPGKALPVFTAECLAADFLKASGLGDEVWHSRRVDGGELISVLYGPCVRVGGVALDPAGGPVIAGSGVQSNIGRSVFLDMLSGRSRRAPDSGAPRAAPGFRGGAFVRA